MTRNDVAREGSKKDNRLSRTAQPVGVKLRNGHLFRRDSRSGNYFFLAGLAAGFALVDLAAVFLAAGFFSAISVAPFEGGA